MTFATFIVVIPGADSDPRRHEKTNVDATQLWAQVLRGRRGALGP